VEIRLETAAGPSPSPASAPAPSSAQAAPAAAAPAPAPRKAPEQTVVMQRGVSLNELEQGPRGGGFDTSKIFSKKSNQTNKWFLIIGIIAIVVIGAIFLFTLSALNK